MRFPPYLLLAMLAVASFGCATPHVPVPARVESGFDPATDTLAYPNGLFWEYEAGVHVPSRAARSGVRGADPELFAQRCTFMTRSVRQFYHGARFDPSLPRGSEEHYRELVRRVLASDPRRESPAGDLVVIPGFANLREFSSYHEELLKNNTRGRWRSYLQRGNWRMIFPFSPEHQRTTAESLLASLAEGHPPIVHVLRFPRITINHTLLIHGARSTATEVRFFAYDPNQPDRTLVLRYDREQATFLFPRTRYFLGGRVSAYEIYDGFLY
ncbi:MAG: hypothetical protein JRS35_03815 [Deltaproteobacteria bacterium]|nr:hypothetical protein [Deltaproteobacteria bacterium]